MARRDTQYNLTTPRSFDDFTFYLSPNSVNTNNHNNNNNNSIDNNNNNNDENIDSSVYDRQSMRTINIDYSNSISHDPFHSERALSENYTDFLSPNYPTTNNNNNNNNDNDVNNNIHYSNPTIFNLDNNNPIFNNSYNNINYDNNRTNINNHNNGNNNNKSPRRKLSLSQRLDNFFSKTDEYDILTLQKLHEKKRKRFRRRRIMPVNEIRSARSVRIIESSTRVSVNNNNNNENGNNGCDGDIIMPIDSPASLPVAIASINGYLPVTPTALPIENTPLKAGASTLCSYNHSNHNIYHKNNNKSNKYGYYHYGALNSARKYGSIDFDNENDNSTVVDSPETVHIAQISASGSMRRKFNDRKKRRLNRNRNRKKLAVPASDSDVDSDSDRDSGDTSDSEDSAENIRKSNEIWTFRHTISYWVAVSFIIGGIFFTIGALASYLKMDDKIDQFALTTMPYFAGQVFYVLGCYGAYFEVINDSSSHDSHKNKKKRKKKTIASMTNGSCSNSNGNNDSVTNSNNDNDNDGKRRVMYLIYPTLFMSSKYKCDNDDLMDLITSDEYTLCVYYLIRSVLYQLYVSHDVIYFIYGIDQSTFEYNTLFSVIFKQIPFIVATLLFIIGSLYMFRLNYCFKFRIRKLGWWVAWLNFLGGVCFIFGGIGSIWLNNNNSGTNSNTHNTQNDNDNGDSLMPKSVEHIFFGTFNLIQFCFGSILYLSGAILTLLMWKFEQFGFAFLPAININERIEDSDDEESDDDNGNDNIGNNGNEGNNNNNIVNNRKNTNEMRRLKNSNKKLANGTIRRDSVNFKQLFFITLYCLLICVGSIGCVYSLYCIFYKDWIKDFLLAMMLPMGMLVIGSHLHKDPEIEPYSKLLWFVRMIMIWYFINMTINTFHVSTAQCGKYGSEIKNCV